MNKKDFIKLYIKKHPDTLTSTVINGLSEKLNIPYGDMGVICDELVESDELILTDNDTYVVNQ